jgi:hypothetical protein
MNWVEPLSKPRMRRSRPLTGMRLDMARVIVAFVGELEPTGVPQHVGMDKKAEFRGHARPGHHALISGCGKRCATFRDEDVGGCWCFAQELAQCATFPGRYRMHAGIPTLGPAHMQAPCGEVDVVPAECHQLRGSEAVAVATRMAVASRCPERFSLAASMSRSTSRSVRYSRLRCRLLHLLRLEPACEVASFP